MKYSPLSWAKLNKIFLCFSEDITATAAAKIIGLNRNTINNYFFEIRKLIFEESLLNIKKELGEPLCDESYFGAKRLRGKRGRGAVEKTPVFSFTPVRWAKKERRQGFCCASARVLGR